MPANAPAALRAYERLIHDHSPRLGLVAPDDLDRIWDRHILDSLRALSCLGPGSIRVVDIGSGAGLPGIPLAIARPDARFVLLEPNRRRAGFLELAVERLGLPNVAVVNTGATPSRTSGPAGGMEPADVCTLRAVAPPNEAWRLAAPLLSAEGVVVYFAGRSWSSQDERALVTRHVDARVCAGPSLDGGGPVVIMSRRPASSHRAD